MEKEKYECGMIGLGTMGRNLALNINDHGRSVAGFDKEQSQVELFNNTTAGREMSASTELEEFIRSLKVPRIILLLVPAGKIVDAVISELKPLLSQNDLLLDCGNSHFTDTDRRIAELEKTAVHFMGVGISGGESGARFGPSIMPGGPHEEYDRVAALLESIAAIAEGEPCVTWLGPGSAGHYVKMVHNGIEYALMQLIAETYHLLKVAGGMNNAELHAVYTGWNERKLRSFLVKITADIFMQHDEMTGDILIDKILDSAHQKGTGAWTTEDGIKLQVPLPVIDTAVSMRDLSACKKERLTAQQKLRGPSPEFNGSKNELVSLLEDALYFSMITAYAQGLALLHVASGKYGYELNLEEVIKTWRGGCIIRAALLTDIRKAFARDRGLSNLLLSDIFSEKLVLSQKSIRRVVQAGAETGIPLPAMMASLAYYDSYRSGWLPANLLQAQRDYFGAHTYERNDREGIFHTIWNGEEK